MSEGATLANEATLRLRDRMVNEETERLSESRDVLDEGTETVGSLLLKQVKRKAEVNT